MKYELGNLRIITGAALYPIVLGEVTVAWCRDRELAAKIVVLLNRQEGRE